LPGFGKTGAGKNRTEKYQKMIFVKPQLTLLFTASTTGKDLFTLSI
jgi:hypothetical protein